MSETVIIGATSDSSEIPELDISEHIEYIRHNLESLIMLPGCGQESLSDLTVINQLRADFPNLKQVGIICSWFINGTDISSATIKPGTENAQNSSEWKVGNYTTENAHQISICETNGEKIVNFGGTVSDDKLLAWVNKAKELGLEIAFYPMLLVDNPEKAWRGYITGNAEDVVKFYKEQYKPFITHYLELLGDKVKIFYIGSELEGLTSIKDEQNQFPFVDKLISLAKKVKNALQKSEVSYAANWTEYHSCHGGLRPLDNLWSHPAIDFVGINYYMPLTNSQEQDLHNVETIKRGFESGEGWDYYLSNECLEPFSDHSYAWKDLAFWYYNQHFEPGNGNPTNWIPESKDIKLSEFGIRSLDRATDAPYLYGKDVPKNSNGKVDNIIQILAIEAFLRHIKEKEFIVGGYYYGYDSRGKDWDKKYFDGNEYARGHGLDRKIGINKEST